MHFTISHQPENRADVTGDSRAELRALLADVERIDSIQFLLRKTDSDEVLIAYFNARRAFLIWLGSDGEWCHPVHANWDKLEDKGEEFYLENGQLDELPLRMTSPKTEAIELLTHYFEHGELSSAVQWTNEQYWE